MAYLVIKNKREKKDTKNNPKESQILELLEKEFKIAMANMSR